MEAILNLRISSLLQNNINASERMSDYRANDVITIGVNDLVHFVSENGFSEKTVAFCEKEDRLCIIEDSIDLWRTFYFERGERSAESVFPQKEEAVKDVLNRLLKMAKLELNSRYKAAHPEENLPRLVDM